MILDKTQISLTALAAAVTLSVSGLALAEDMPSDLIDPDGAAAAALEAAAAAAAEEAAEGEDGWDYSLSVGANGAWSYANNVVGASADGSTYQFGVVVNGAANMRKGRHDWQNTLNILHNQTRTPQVPVFVKSGDSLDLSSTYLLRLEKVDWLGPYGRFKLNTQLFNGFAVSADAFDYVLQDADGGTLTGTADVDAENGVARLPLSAGFEPLLMRQSAGFFANPVEKDELVVKAKAGVGVQEVLTGGGYVQADDEATEDVIEFAQLQDSTQAGGEFNLNLSGALNENVNWSASAGYFLPIITSNDTLATGTAGLNQEYGLNVGVKLSKWASLDYALSAKQIPSVSEDWQVLSSVMLTAAFNVIE